MHIPVLEKEVLACLDPKPNENFVDCTLGEGGHARAILEKTGPRGKVLGIEWDGALARHTRLLLSRTPCKNRLILVHGNFADLKDIAEKQKFYPVHGILFDLGMSSWHIEESGRGFTFRKAEPLDMRYNEEHPLTAEKILNYWSRHELENIFREYGEERFSSRIAREVVSARSRAPLSRTFHLVKIIERAIVRSQRQNIHPATRVFQALRIAVNQELENLKKGLFAASELVSKGGRIAVISFHSLEDRIVKEFFRNTASLRVLGKKPVTPSAREKEQNMRSRSAKLRAAIKE